jgi:hypothetical protein
VKRLVATVRFELGTGEKPADFLEHASTFAEVLAVAGVVARWEFDTDTYEIHAGDEHGLGWEGIRPEVVSVEMEDFEEPAQKDGAP